MAEEEKSENTEASEENKEEKKTKSPLLIILALVIGLILISWAASRFLGIAGTKVAEKAVEQALEQSEEVTDVDISRDGNEVRVETEEGTFTAGNQELPENFPSDVPVYPGSTVVTTAAGDDVVSVTLDTDDALSKVVDFYQGVLSDQDWEVTQTATLENAVVISFMKGSMEGVIAVTESEEQTSITISLDLGGE